MSNAGESGAIRLVTEIPGPRSRALSARATQSIPNAILSGEKIFAASGEGAVLEDVDGNRFIDFVGGVGCLVVGHHHPRVIEAIKKQAERFTHTDFGLVPYELYVELAEMLSAACGGGYKVALFNSGAEAVENAVKIARRATGKPAIVCFEGAFHGRTLLGMTLTDRQVPYKEGFGPFAPQIHRAPYPGLAGTSLEQSLDSVRELFSTERVAGVIVEPVLGEGGFVVPPPEFLPMLSILCEEHDAVLIADEVQTGFGRTGAFLASQLIGVRPGLVTLGKSIAAGLPLSAVVGEARWMDVPPPNSLGGTYPGNPVACAAALAVMKVIEDEGLIERAGLIGKLLKGFWETQAISRPEITDVRGQGSMVGAEFSDPGSVDGLLAMARSRGVLMMSAGPRGQVIRHLMPLVITETQLAEAFAVLETCR